MAKGRKAKRLQPKVSIGIYQHDWIPGWAAFHATGATRRGTRAHVVLNLGSLLAAVETKELHPRDLPYMVAESLMHEIIHALEEWAGEQFSEKRVERLLAKYRRKYRRETIWEQDESAAIRKNRRERGQK